jgi:hypothetical protein
MVRNAVLVVAILVTAVAPVQAAAAKGAGRGLVPMPPVAHPNNHRPFHHHSFNRRPFVPFWGINADAPPVSYGPSVIYVPVPTYESPTAYSRPADRTISSESGLPPMPSVVPYPNGRYVLTGDGVTSPYKWVWIPNPPTAPPTAPQPAEAAASHSARLYRWVDDQGVVHLTQGRDSVPERYRAQLKLAGAP